MSKTLGDLVMNIPFIIGLIVVFSTMIYANVLVFHNENKKPRNKVHFIVTKQECLSLIVLNKSKEWFYLCDEEDFTYWNLNSADFADMKDGDIREVFINLED